MTAKLKIDITITASRLLAYIIMISTLLFSFLFGNSEVIIFGISIAAGLHGLTSWSDGMTKRREIGNRRWRSERYDDDYEYERQRPIEEIG